MAKSVPLCREVAIRIADWPTIYMDMRLADSHNWCRDSPMEHSPYEPSEQAILRRVLRRGDVVYDIGANVGLHSALMSKLIGAAGRLMAFEPNLQLMPSLGHTIREMGNARLFTLALSDSEGTADLFVDERDHSMSSLANWTGNRGRATRRVVCSTMSLDAVCRRENLPAPDFVKCDVEGAELHVFRGAAGIINSATAPMILFEANVHAAGGFQQEIDAAGKYLLSLAAPRYRLFSVPDARPLERFDPVHSNILAVPEARMDRLEEISGLCSPQACPAEEMLVGQ